VQKKEKKKKKKRAAAAAMVEAEQVEAALREALQYAEEAFLAMVEKHVEREPGRQDLAMAGSCVLVALLYGGRIYTMSLGDSRALLATCRSSRSAMAEDHHHQNHQNHQDHQDHQNHHQHHQNHQNHQNHHLQPIDLQATQLNKEHLLSNREEKLALEALHPAEAAAGKLFRHGKVKGKLHVTRALGAGYLKRVS
jgi:pyruvate dehydrogenase phosphatase